MGGEGAFHFPRGVGGGVQAEAVAVLAGGETVGENAGEVFGRNADAVVLHGEEHAAGRAALDPERDGLVGAPAIVRGVFGVADQVDENLEDLAFLAEDGGNGMELADDAHGVADEGAGVHAEGILHQLLGAERFDDADHGGVGLLHRDDLLDVVDVFLEGIEFFEQAVAFRDGMLREGGEQVGEAAALGIVEEKLAEVGAAFVEEFGNLDEAFGLGLAEPGGDDAGGNVEAVEDVADVVEHAGGDLGHAGQARGVHELTLGLFEREFRFLDLGDVLADAEGADDGALFVAERHFAGEHPGDVAVGPRFLFEFADDGDAGVDDGFLVLPRRLRVGVIEEIEIGLADEFVGAGKSMVFEHGGADGDEARIAVLEIDVVGNVFQEGGDEGAIERAVARRFKGRGGGGGGVHWAKAQSAWGLEKPVVGGRWRASMTRRSSGLTGLAR